VDTGFAAHLPHTGTLLEAAGRYPMFSRKSNKFNYFNALT